MIQGAKLAFGLALLGGLLLWQNNGRELLDVLQRFEVRYLLALALVAL